LGEIAEHVHSITKNLKNSNKRIENILANLNQMSDSLVKANIAGTVRNANQALADVSQVMGKINRGEGSLGMLINDNKLYNNLESSSRDLDSLLTDLKAHPGRYVHFSVFGKKDRKSQSKANK
jgi:phospholipid/cholesterol/gamma-HCH transport system substrate-binding protein